MLASEGLVELLPNRGAVALSLSEQGRNRHLRGDGQSGSAVRRTGCRASRTRNWRKSAPCTLKCLRPTHGATCPVITRSTRKSTPASTQRRRTRCWRAPIAQLNARLQALRFRSNQDGQKWQRAVNEHERMIDALTRRDGAAMRAVLVEHLNNKLDAVLDLMRTGQLDRSRAAS